MRMILLPNRELLQVYLHRVTDNSFSMRSEQHWEFKVVQTGTERAGFSSVLSINPFFSID